MISIPLSVHTQSDMDLHDIPECASLHTISRQHGPVSRPKIITRLSDVCCSLRYRCKSYYELSRYRENTIANLDIRTDGYH